MSTILLDDKHGVLGNVGLRPSSSPEVMLGAAPVVASEGGGALLVRTHRKPDGAADSAADQAAEVGQEAVQTQAPETADPPTVVPTLNAAPALAGVDAAAELLTTGSPAAAEREKKRREQFRADASRLEDLFTKEDHGLTPEEKQQLERDLQYSADKEQATKQAILVEKLIHESGQPRELVERMYDVLMPEYLKERLGVTTPQTLEQSYDLVKGEYEVQQSLGHDALLAVVEILPPAQAFQHWRLAHENKPGFNQARLAEYELQFEMMHEQATRKLGKHARLAKNILVELEREYGAMPSTTGREVASGMGRLDYAVEDLLAVPKEERDKVLAAVIIGAEAKGYAKKDSLFQKLGETWQRRVEKLGGGLPGSLKRKQLLRIKRELEDGKGLPQHWGDDENLIFRNMMIGADTHERNMPENRQSLRRQFTPEEKKVFHARADRDLDAMDLGAELRKVGEGSVDPVKAANLLETSLMGIVDTLPSMAVAGTGVGLLFNYGMLEEQAYQDLGRWNPDMSREDRSRISSVAAPLMAAGDFLESKLLLGRLPAFSSALRGLTGSALKRFGLRTGAGLVVEWGADTGQDLAPHAVQSILSALEKDLPGTRWREILGENFSGQHQLELFAVLLPLSLIGAGAGRVEDFRQARELVSNRLLLEAAGFNDAQVAEVRAFAGRGDLEGAFGAVRQTYASIDFKSAEVLAQRERAGKEFLADQENRAASVQMLEAKGVLPPLANTAEGWRVRYRDGSNRVYQSKAQADAARWQWARDREIAVSQKFREAVEQVESTAELDSEFILRLRNEEMTIGRFRRENPHLNDQVDVRIQQGKALAPGGQAEATAGPQQIQEEESLAFEESTAMSTATASSAEAQEAAGVVLGTSVSEYLEGVHTTTMTFYKGHTAFTAMEEMVEGKAKKLLALPGKREWMRRALREVEERTGQQIFRTRDDAQLDDSDLVEAWSHLSLSLYVGRSGRGEELAQGFDEKGYRRTMIELLGTEAGPALRSQRTLLESVYRRAAALNGLKKQGVLDAELESTLAWQLGLEGRRGGESAMEEGGAQEQGRAQRELESGAVVAPSASTGVMTLESSAVADFSGPSFSLIPGEGTQASAEIDRISRFLLGPVTATSLGTEVPAFPRMAELLDWVAADWQKRTGGAATHAALGEIKLDRRAAANSAAHGMGPMKQQAFYLVPEIISTGELLGQLEKTDPAKPDAFLIGAPVRIGGLDYYGLVEVRRDANMSRLYVHEAVLRKPQGGVQSAASGQAKKPHGAPPGAIRKLLDEVLGVNKAQSDASSVIDTSTGTTSQNERAFGAATTQPSESVRAETAPDVTESAPAGGQPVQTPGVAGDSNTTLSLVQNDSRNLPDLIDLAGRPGKGKEWAETAPLTTKQRQMLEEATGQSLDQYTRAVDRGGLRQVYTQHGPGSEDAHPITEEDLQALPEIVTSPGAVMVDPGDGLGYTTLRHMRFHNGWWYQYTEEVRGGKSGQKALVLTDLSKTPGEAMANDEVAAGAGAATSQTMMAEAGAKLRESSRPLRDDSVEEDGQGEQGDGVHLDEGGREGDSASAPEEDTVKAQERERDHQRTVRLSDLLNRVLSPERRIALRERAAFGLQANNVASLETKFQNSARKHILAEGQIESADLEAEVEKIYQEIFGKHAVPQGEATEASLKRRDIQKKVGDTLAKYHEALSIADEKGDAEMAAVARNTFVEETTAIEGGPPNLNWRDPYSEPTFKHAFSDKHGHGQGLEDKRMIDRARNKGVQIGRYSDDRLAAAYAGAISKQGAGIYDVMLPKGLEADVALPNGKIILGDMMRVVVGLDGKIDSSYPFSSRHTTTPKKDQSDGGEVH